MTKNMCKGITLKYKRKKTIAYELLCIAEDLLGYGPSYKESIIQRLEELLIFTKQSK